jgi:hypothetical protein
VPLRIEIKPVASRNEPMLPGLIIFEENSGVILYLPSSQAPGKIQRRRSNNVGKKGL